MFQHESDDWLLISTNICNRDIFKGKDYLEGSPVNIESTNTMSYLQIS